MIRWWDGDDGDHNNNYADYSYCTYRKTSFEFIFIYSGFVLMFVSVGGFFQLFIAQ